MGVFLTRGILVGDFGWGDSGRGILGANRYIDVERKGEIPVNFFRVHHM